MCAVSNVGDFYSQKWSQNPPQQVAGWSSLSQQQNQFGFVTREDFDQLRREVLEMKDLLIKAKEIDEKTGQKDCEMEEKIKVLRTVAEMVGVSLDDVFKQNNQE